MADIVRDSKGRVVSGALNPGGRPHRVREFVEWLDEPDDEDPAANLSRRRRLWRRLYSIATSGRDVDAKTALGLILAYDMGQPHATLDVTARSLNVGLNLNKATPQQLEVLRAAVRVQQELTGGDEEQEDLAIEVPAAIPDEEKTK